MIDGEVHEVIARQTNIKFWSSVASSELNVSEGEGVDIS